MKQHCWCQMRNPRKGTMVEPEDADFVRDGIPMCALMCAIEYDRTLEVREQIALGQVNGVAARLP